MTQDQKSTFGGFVIIALGIALIIGVLCIPFYAFPKYKVWQREQRGIAQLREAEWSKRIAVEEAKARLESEKLNAEAEVERAKGAAQAISIEQGALTENYIRYLWVRQQENLNDKTVIYIPTEAGLPILEAGRGQ